TALGKILMALARKTAYPFEIWPGHVCKLGLGTRRAPEVWRVAQNEVEFAAHYRTEHISLVHLDFARHAIIGRVYSGALRGGGIDVNRHHFLCASRRRKRHQSCARADLKHTAITMPWYERRARF